MLFSTHTASICEFEKRNYKKKNSSCILKTPQVGLEPTTYRLTADRSTAELLRIYFYFEYVNI